MKNNSYISKEKIESITRRVILEEIRSKYSNIIKEDQQEDQESLFNKGDYIMYSKESYPENYLKIKKINNTAKQYTVDEISVNKKGEYFYTKDREAPFLFINQDYEKNGKKISEQEYEEELSNYYDGSKKSSAETEKAEDSQDILTSPDTVDDIQAQSGNANVSRKDIKKILANILAKIKEKTGNKKISLKKVREIISAIANRLKKNYNLDDESLSRMYDDISTSVTSDSNATPEEPAQPAAATSDTDAATAAPDADTTPDTEDDKKEKGASVWEKTKYIIAKAGGRYKVNGKLFKKKKIREEEKKKIEDILQKTSNSVLKDIDSKIKQAYPEFPNNEVGKDFLSGVEQIASVYDTIVEKTKKEGADQLPVDLSNEMINDLREYVKNLLDVELKAFYATVDEQKEHEEYVEMLLEDAAADLRAKLKADREKRGGGKGKEDEFQSTKISTLRSNKLPLTLAGVGTSLGAFSWLVNTEWFKSLFNEISQENYTKLVPEESKEILPIQKGDGVYKFLSKTTGINLDGTQDPQKLVDALKQIGGGDANKGVELLCQKDGVMMRPEDAEKGLKAFLKNPDQYNNLGQFFRGEATGTGKLVPTDTTLYGTISGRQMVTTLVKMVPMMFARTSIKTGAGYAAAKGFANVLGPIGVGLLIAGAAVKLMRMKGLKTSRAATLNALYQSLRNIPGGAIVEPEGQVDTSIEPPPINVTAPSGTTAATPSTTEPQGTTAGVEPTVEPQTSPETEPTAAEPETPATEPETSPTTPEPGAEEPEKEKEGEKEDEKDYDKLYQILKSTFKFIGDNRDRLYFKEKDNVVTEVKYISSTEAYSEIAKKVGLRKLQAFESLLKKIDAIRNVVYKIPPGVDKDLNAILKKFIENPIKDINFDTLLNIQYSKKGKQKQELDNLVNLINTLFDNIYKKSAEKGNMVDKAFAIVRDTMKEAKSDVKTNIIRKNITPKSGRFSTNLVRYIIMFLLDSYKLFKYLHSLKKSGSSKPDVDTTASSVSSVVPTTSTEPETDDKKGTSVRDSLPEEQSTFRSEATKKILDYFAEALGIPKLEGNIKDVPFKKWMMGANPELGQEVYEELGTPREAYDVITRYKEKNP